MKSKIVISDNFVMAEPGAAISIKRVVDQIAFTKLRLDQDDREMAERAARPKTAAEIGSYEYKGLDR